MSRMRSAIHKHTPNLTLTLSHPHPPSFLLPSPTLTLTPFIRTSTLFPSLCLILSSPSPFPFSLLPHSASPPTCPIALPSSHPPTLITLIPHLVYTIGGASTLCASLLARRSSSDSCSGLASSPTPQVEEGHQPPAVAKSVVSC